MKHFLRLFCLTFSLVGGLGGVTAATLYPEYQTFSEDDTQSFFQPRLIDGEYDSDVLAFLPSPQARADFLTTKSVGQFMASVGSLSAKNFFVREALAAQLPLTQNWQFHFVHFRNDDFEDQNGATVFEFQYRRPSSRHGWAVYGDSDYKKSRDDMGLAYLYQPKQEVLWRWYLTAPDFTRNQRNQEDDSFDNKPLIAGVKIFKVAPEELLNFLLVHLRTQNEVQWRRPSEDRVYRQAESFFSVEKSITKGHRTRYGYVQWDKKNQGEDPDDGLSPVILQDWRRTRLIARVQQDGAIWQAGVGLSYREWQHQQPKENLSMSNVQPFWGRKITSWSGDNCSWWAQYSLTSTDYDGHITNVRSPRSRVDHRGNLKAIWRPQGQVEKPLELVALFTFDLDRFLKSDRWEGGNIQLVSEF